MSVIPVQRDADEEIGLYVDDTGGPGRPVILIHAWPLCLKMWSPQLPALRDAGYRVISYDRRGFGRSDRATTGYDYDQLAADLHAVIEKLDLSHVSLVGFSMGGGEVARYVSTYGTKRLAAVVFAPSVTPFMLRTTDNPDGPLTAEDLDDATTSLMNDPRTFYEEQMDEFFEVDGTNVADPETVNRSLDWSDQSSDTATLACMRTWARADLAHVDVPSLIIHGGGDASVPFDDSARRTHEMIPGSRLHRIDRSPHGCNMTHSDGFNDVLVDFLGVAA